MTGPHRRLRAALPTQQWERNVWVVTGSIFVAFSGFTVVMPFLPLYVQELGVRDPAAVALWSGLIFGVSPLLAGVMAPVWGALADRYGRKAMFVRSLVVFVLIAACMGFATSVVQLFALRILWGVFGGMGAMALSMITSSAPEEKVGAAIGRFQAAQMLTNLSGPLLGGVLASALGIRNTFFVSAGLYAVALVAVVALFKEPPARQVEARDRPGVPLRRLVLLPALLPLAGVLFLSQFVDRSMNALLPLYIAQLGTPPRSVVFWAGALTSAGAVASALAASFGGRLAGSRSPRSLLLGSLAGGVVAALALAAVQSVQQLFAARVLLGLVAGGAATLAFTVGSRHLPRESRGASFGLLSTGSMVGGGLSPVIAGVIAGASLRAVFVTGAVLYVLSGLVALRLPREDAAAFAGEQPETRDAAGPARVG
jgi:MFS family permease